MFCFDNDFDVMEDEYNTDYRTEYDDYLNGCIDAERRQEEQFEFDCFTEAYQHQPVFGDEACGTEPDWFEPFFCPCVQADWWLWAECIAYEQKRLYLALNGVCIPEWERPCNDLMQPWDDNDLPF